MNKYRLMIAALLLATLFIAYKYNASVGSVDFDHITDDGLYIRFNELDCSDLDNVSLGAFISISAVRENGYNVCQRVGIKFQLVFEDKFKLPNNQNFEWVNNDCDQRNVLSKSLSIPIKEESYKLCDLHLKGVRVLDYYLSPINRELKKTSDSLGQQARLDSSIPQLDAVTNKTLDYYFQDSKEIMLIQKRLAIYSDYSGPFDGVFNEQMKKKIRILLDAHLFFFEPVESEASLLILGVKK